MISMTSQIVGDCTVCSTVCSNADQPKHQSSAALAFVREIHLWRVNSPSQRASNVEMFPFDDVLMNSRQALINQPTSTALANWGWRAPVCRTVEMLIYECIPTFIVPIPVNIMSNNVPHCCTKSISWLGHGIFQINTDKMSSVDLVIVNIYISLFRHKTCLFD